MTNRRYLDKNKSVSMHKRNLETIATEMFKAIKGLLSTFFRVFLTQEKH